jgi:hypothetical protein
MITLECGKPDYVPSFPKPAAAISLMNFGLGGDGSEYKPVCPPKPQERGEQSRFLESESEKELEEICNVKKVMSKRKMTKPKFKNDKSFVRNLNDVHIPNDVEKRNLCGPENSGNGKSEAAHDVGGGSEPEKDEIDVGGGSEPEKDEIEEDDSAESWADTRVKGWLRPRVKTRRMNERALESFWRQGTGGPRAVFEPKAAVSDPSPHSQSTCRSCRFDAKMSNADAMKSPGPPTARNSPSAGSPPSTRDSPDNSSSSGEPLIRPG